MRDDKSEVEKLLYDTEFLLANKDSQIEKMDTEFKKQNTHN